MAPDLGVRSYLRYGGSTTNGRLLEGDQDVGGRNVLRNDVDLAVEFAPTAGIAATVQFAITPSMTWSYTDTRTMVVEPLDGTGSYLAGEDAPDVKRKTSGLTGVWFGAALAPFSEQYEKNQHATWRLDLGIRTPSAGRNLWVARNQARGSSPGGSAVRVSGAFSSDRGVGEPWITGAWVHENRVTVDVVDEGGTTWAKNLELKPADTFDLRSGISLRGYENAADGSALDVELWFGAGYRAWEDIASGLYLPNVLDSARAIPVTTGDSISAVSGLGLEYTVNEFVSLRTGAEFTYRTPYRLEHVYDVRTSPDTWQLGWFFTVQGRGTFRPESGAIDE
jgi:hypothetical protein